MFRREIVTAETKIELWKKIQRLKKKYPELEIFSKGDGYRKLWLYADVRYDDGTPLPDILDKRFEIWTFSSEDERRNFVEHWAKNYWLRDWEKHCNNGHVWQIIFLRKNCQL